MARHPNMPVCRRHHVVCNDVLYTDMWPTPGTKEGILVLTWRKLRPELTRKGLPTHFYFGNDMVASKVMK